MTRGELRAARAQATETFISRALENMDSLWATRLRAGMDPDFLPELGETNRERLLAIVDRAAEVLAADGKAKEGKRAA